MQETDTKESNSEICKLKVMVVDDSPSIRMSTKKSLKDYCEVIACEDGLEAISKMAEFQPELVLMDILMPKIDGYETLAIMRMNDMFASTPIVMMSSKGGVFDIAQGKLLGFTDSVQKPVPPQALRELIKKILPNHPSLSLTQEPFDE
jgi:twitching motility two-component system response regulator PilG